mmetsp:Transcript_15126/g.51039  ORF Transcript_15126/g.51039 Transcript_15126/m.51039 type:complete len:81 (+) Transcript_15126:708-950(+)
MGNDELLAVAGHLDPHPRTCNMAGWWERTWSWMLETTASKSTRTWSEWELTCSPMDEGVEPCGKNLKQHLLNPWGRRLDM